MVDALGRVDDAFADHAVAGLQRGDIAPGLDDFADPFVAGDDGIGDRDDVFAGEQLVVRMADADAARADEDFVVVDPRALHLRDHRLPGFVENERLHRDLPVVVLATASIFPLKAEANTASSKAMSSTNCSPVIG